MRDQEHPLAAEVVAQRAGHRHRDDLAERVDGDRPAAPGQLGAEVGLDRVQRGRDDGLVDRGHEQRDRDHGEHDVPARQRFRASGSGGCSGRRSCSYASCPHSRRDYLLAGKQPTFVRTSRRGGSGGCRERDQVAPGHRAAGAAVQRVVRERGPDAHAGIGARPRRPPRPDRPRRADRAGGPQPDDGVPRGGQARPRRPGPPRRRTPPTSARSSSRPPRPAGGPTSASSPPAPRRSPRSSTGSPRT